MITLENVSKRYDGKTAVDGVSMEIPDGEVCVLIGPSGCGKTTTLRMINRLIEPSSGRILLDGLDVAGMRPEELRRGLGYVIQSTGLFPHLTVAANIGVVPRLLGWSKTRIAERADELLTLVGLDPAAYRGEYPQRLSGGEAQRVGVARALAADPPVLLMDEPFGAVDPLNRERLQTEFVRIQRELKKTVVFVTHDIDEAVRLADRIAIMRNGKLEQFDTPEAVMEQPSNQFVHDFVGSDRALKRLARVPVSAVMRSPAVAFVGAEDRALRDAAGRRRFIYVIERDGVLVGWLDSSRVQDGHTTHDLVTRVDPVEVSITPEDTLRDALSRMLELGFRSIPVIDGEHRLVGEVTLSAVEDAVGGGDEE